MQLRPYQSDLINGIRQSWADGAKNICAVLPTGGGKTVVFSSLLQAHNGASVAIAHRRELVGQMSVTLARHGVRHRIIAPPSTIRQIVHRQMVDVGRSLYDDRAPCAVASVDTLVRLAPDQWTQQVGLWVCDEGHHLVRDNKWHKATLLFPNARGLAVTATALRADGKGLGRHADGVIDRLVVGPDMRQLIDAGYLTEYRIFAPASDLDRAALPISETTGDFSLNAMRDAVKGSHITGDVVESYLKIAPGKRGITFVVSVELATETAARFRAAGVAAEAVSAETDESVRATAIRRFAAGEIKQLVNVDLFGEGFDVPACEVVSMARPTESYGLYAQQFGRALRLLDGKHHALIIDHVGNVLRHGLPDAPRLWTLDRRERRSRSAPDDSEVKIRVCAKCTAVFERFHKECPFCGFYPEPASRAAPDHVDGDLTEMDPAFLARLRASADLMQPPTVPYGAAPVVEGAIRKRHRERIVAQHALREAIAWWAGWQQAQGRSDSEGYRRFYLEFGTDVATAQTLNAGDATALMERVRATLPKGVLAA